MCPGRERDDGRRMVGDVMRRARNEKYIGGRIGEAGRGKRVVFFSYGPAHQNAGGGAAHVRASMSRAAPEYYCACLGNISISARGGEIAMREGVMRVERRCRTL